MKKRNTFNEKRRVIMISLIYILKFAMFLKQVYIYIYLYKYYERKKGSNYISRQACFVNCFTLQGFNYCLSTVPRKNRLTDFLYICIYLYLSVSFWWEKKDVCFMCIKGVYIYIYTCNQSSFVVFSWIYHHTKFILVIYNWNLWIL